MIICFGCNRDIDTLENPKAGHTYDCPLWKNCRRCNERYIEDQGGLRIKMIKVNRYSFNARQYYPVLLCQSCETNVMKQIFGADAFSNDTFE